MAKATIKELERAAQKAVALETLIEQIEYMNSAHGRHFAFVRVDRRSVESRIALKALKLLAATEGATK